LSVHGIYFKKLLFGLQGSRAEDGSANGMVSEFGDDNFVVGNWEFKEIISRDGHMKLSSQVFFASIDQRSERAAGESTCGCYCRLVPSKSEYDAYSVTV